MKCFSLVEISILVDQKKFQWFQKVKAKKNKQTNKQNKNKKQKQKKPAFHFPPSLLQFSLFSFPFSLFSLPLFSWSVSNNFPVKSLRGALCPPPTPLLCHWSLPPPPITSSSWTVLNCRIFCPPTLEWFSTAFNTKTIVFYLICALPLISTSANYFQLEPDWAPFLYTFY